jgi:hypothetical protein
MERLAWLTLGLALLLLAPASRLASAAAVEDGNALPHLSVLPLLQSPLTAEASFQLCLAHTLLHFC